MDFLRIIRSTIFAVFLGCLSVPNSFALLMGEEDGTPNHFSNVCWSLKVADGNLTRNADDSCSLADQTSAFSPTDIDTDYGDETVTSDWTLNIVSGKQSRNNTAVDDDSCVGEQGSWWYDTNDTQFEFCNANSGAPAAIPTTPGDITDVWSCASGDCTDPVVGAGETLRVDAEGEVESTEIIMHVWNDTGATLYACTAVYISGFNVPNDLPTVAIADADDAAKMDAVGLMEFDASDGTDGKVIVVGHHDDWDTAGFTVGDELYVNVSGTSADNTCSNTLTATRPTGVTAAIQHMGEIMRVNPSNGEIEVSGAGRENDVPNLEDGKFWVGNASNLATAVSLSGDGSLANDGTLTVNDDQHAHTTTTLSGIVNADLSGTAGITAANLALTGGVGIDISTNDLVLDLTELNAMVFGSGTFTTLDFNAGATDPRFTFGSDSLIITNVATLTVPNDSWGDAEVSNTLTASIIDLEAGTVTNIADTEIMVGVGAGDASYVVLSGEATMGNDGAVTLADSVTVTGWVLGTFTGTQGTVATMLINLLDAVGAVDMDYGSVDVTDHTFTSDGGTAIIDGTVTAGGAENYVQFGGGYTADPCTSAGSSEVPDASLFLNTTADETCYCSASGVDLRTTDFSTACYA